MKLSHLFKQSTLYVFYLFVECFRFNFDVNYVSVDSSKDLALKLLNLNSRISTKTLGKRIRYYISKIHL